MLAGVHVSRIIKEMTHYKILVLVELIIKNTWKPLKMLTIKFLLISNIPKPKNLSKQILLYLIALLRHTRTNSREKNKNPQKKFHLNKKTKNIQYMEKQTRKNWVVETARRYLTEQEKND